MYFDNSFHFYLSHDFSGPPTNKSSNFLEDAEFFHLPTPSTKGTSTTSLVKPPNSVSSQPIKQPNTIRIVGKDSDKRSASPARTNTEPPDPLFVIGGNVRSSVPSATPKSVASASDKKLVLLLTLMQ